ncbi:MAG: TetR/AcrR family transcriptional regulator [archaeon]
MAPKVTDDYKQNVRERILVSAGSLFAQNGYHSTSMDDIVKECGLSKGAIYCYFRSKEDLFIALSDMRLATLLDDMKSAFSRNDTASMKLRKAAELHFRQLEDPDDVWRMTLELWVEAPRIPSLETRMKKRYEMTHSFIADIIREGKRNGEFRDDVDEGALSSIILGMLRGLSLHSNKMNQDFDWKRIKKTFLDALYDGIAAKAGES